MEIAIVGTKSLRIKSKNTSFIVNPEKSREAGSRSAGKIDDPVVILTSKPEDYQNFAGKIVIDAPGDFETAGVSIKGEAHDNGITFDFLEEGQRLVILSSPSAAKSKEIEDATAVVAFLKGTADGISEIACEIVAVVGEVENLPADKSNIKKSDKINLKRAEEYKGFIVHLSK